MAKVGETRATILPILAVLGFFSAPFTGLCPAGALAQAGIGQAFRPGWRAAHHSFFRRFFLARFSALTRLGDAFRLKPLQARWKRAENLKKRQTVPRVKSPGLYPPSAVEAP